MTKSIITVSREFGSGGRTIAHKVAERLGVPYYDKELIKAVAEKTGFDPKFIEERGEYAPGAARGKPRSACQCTAPACPPAQSARQARNP